MVGMANAMKDRGSPAMPMPRIADAGRYTLWKRLKVFSDAALRGSSPFHAIALEGIVGGYRLPEMHEIKYATRIDRHAARTGADRTMPGLADTYLFTTFEYGRVRRSLIGGYKEDDPSAQYMMSNYITLSRFVDAHPELFGGGRDERFLGRIAAHARDLLGMGLPMPEKEGDALRKILQMHGERYGWAGISDASMAEDTLGWGVAMEPPPEFGMMRRLSVAAWAVASSRNPRLEVAKEGFFGDYSVQVSEAGAFTQTIIGYYSHGKGNLPLIDPVRGLLSAMYNVQYAHATLKLRAHYAKATGSEAPEEDEGRRMANVMKSASDRVSEIRLEHPELLRPGLWESLRRRICRAAESAMQDAGTLKPEDAKTLGGIIAVNSEKKMDA